ncbi:MAG: hypothetical protein AB7S26_29015 [Sandaracinaceae bacterium]
MARTRVLPKTPNKRGCADVLVARERVLDDAGHVPKGCRFIKGGKVMCTPAVAERVGVIEVKRGQAPPSSAPATRKTRRKVPERTHCYSADSPHPFLKQKVKGRRKLKKGCKKDPKTGKICCTHRVSPKAAKAKSASASTPKTAPSAERRRRGRSQRKRARAVDGLSAWEAWRGGASQAALNDVPFLAREERRSAPGAGLALMDDGALELPSVELALMDDSAEFEPLPDGVMMPRREEHLREFGDFAAMYLGGTVLAGAGLWATYEVLDRIEYFDDKPVARAGAYIGAGAIPALAIWALADGEYANEIRSFAAAYGITVSAVGLLGLFRSLLEQQASSTDDAEQRKSLSDLADSIPWYPPQPDEPTDTTGGGAGSDIVTDTGAGEGGASPGTSSPYPYPHPRYRVR